MRFGRGQGEKRPCYVPRSGFGEFKTGSEMKWREETGLTYSSNSRYSQYLTNRLLCVACGIFSPYSLFIFVCLNLHVPSSSSRLQRYL